MVPLQFAVLYDSPEVFEWSDCLLDLGTDFLVRNILSMKAWTTAAFTRLKPVWKDRRFPSVPRYD